METIERLFFPHRLFAHPKYNISGAAPVFSNFSAIVFVSLFLLSGLFSILYGLLFASAVFIGLLLSLVPYSVLALMGETVVTGPGSKADAIAVKDLAVRAFLNWFILILTSFYIGSLSEGLLAFPVGVVIAACINMYSLFNVLLKARN